jgi:uncharacterized protein YodC (DUF2158 family)
MRAEALRQEAEAAKDRVICPLLPGMVVRLKSGGPMMTIAQRRGVDYSYVFWMDDNGHLHEHEILSCLLMEA